MERLDAVIRVLPREICTLSGQVFAARDHFRVANYVLREPRIALAALMLQVAPSSL
jgi:hypothetical protein